jgi:chromosome partitioning protein
MARAGKQVLIVDLDAQGNVADVLGIEKRSGLYQLLVTEQYSEAISSTGRQGLTAILGNKTTVDAKTILAGKAFREMALKRALGQVARGIDVCVLDCAPGVDVLQIAALVACDAFIMPVSLQHLAVVGAADALATAAALREAGANAGRFLGVIPTMWERSTKESHQQLQLLAEDFKKLVWPPIPQDQAAKESPAFGETLWERAPRCKAIRGIELRSGQWAGGYQAVLDRMMQEVGCG